MRCTKKSLIISCQKTKYGCNWRQKYLCCSIATCSVCLCNNFFEAYDKTIINFISITNENEDSKVNSIYDKDLQEPHDSDGDVIVDGYFYSLKVTKTNHACSNDLYNFLWGV